MELQEELLRIMDGKTYPSIEFLQKHAPLEQLLVLNQQEFEVYVRDFPAYLEAIAIKISPEGPDKDIRRKLEENILEERTGELEGIKSHRELFLHTQVKLQFKRSDFENIQLLPESRVYKKWLNHVVHSAPPYLSIPVMNVYVEGSKNDGQELALDKPKVDPDAAVNNHPLVVYRKLSPKDLVLKRRHSMVEGDHRHAAYRATLKLADTPEKEREVIEVIQITHKKWLNYHEGVAQYCKVSKEYLLPKA